MTDKQQLIANKTCANCQTASAELPPEINNLLQTELVMIIHNPPLPAVAAASLARPRSYQPRSTLTPGV